MILSLRKFKLSLGPVISRRDTKSRVSRAGVHQSVSCIAALLGVVNQGALECSDSRRKECVYRDCDTVEPEESIGAPM